MAARKTTKRTAPPVPAVKACSECGGTGSVPTTVRVGRRHRTVGQQAGICLACLGTGEVPAGGE
ncbi:hypothetical protein [Streptomyces sp. NPDC020298]|uniref:hypothetical protein n=1 Tax=unclassified Streptomyces TaxID=2593676 RepID=UPI0033F509D9